MPATSAAAETPTPSSPQGTPPAPSATQPSSRAARAPHAHARPAAGHQRGPTAQQPRSAMTAIATTTVNSPASNARASSSPSSLTSPPPSPQLAPTPAAQLRAQPTPSSSPLASPQCSDTTPPPPSPRPALDASASSLRCPHYPTFRGVRGGMGPPANGNGGCTKTRTPGWGWGWGPGRALWPAGQSLTHKRPRWTLEHRMPCPGVRPQSPPRLPRPQRRQTIRRLPDRAYALPQLRQAEPSLFRLLAPSLLCLEPL